MSKSKFIVLSLLITCLIVFITQNAMAGADWQEKQRDMFALIPVKPGDVIDKSNCEKVKDLLPEPVSEAVKAGDWVLNIGEFEYDHDFDAEYYELCARNAGIYTLGEKKEIIELKTGKYPKFIRGMAFPEIDMKSDPDGPVKFMHNNNLNIYMYGTYKTITYPEKGNLQWIGRDGYERGVMFTAENNFWWNRPGGEIPNPRELKFTFFLFTQAPYDLTGTASLYYRHLDGRADSVYAYVPAIRRVKRLSGANRSDPQMGSDQCMDDADGFNGHIESMKWSYIGEKIILKPLYKGDAKSPRQCKLTKSGAWEYFCYDISKMGYETDGWPGAPWAYTNLIWVPRKMYIFKAEPLDPYYGYGEMEIYLDKMTTMVSFNMKYSRAGEFWKMIINIPGPATWKGGRKFFSVQGPMSVVDAKSDHASNLCYEGNVLHFDSPSVNPRNHTPLNLRTATK